MNSSGNSNPESLEYVEVEVFDIGPPNSIPSVLIEIDDSKKIADTPAQTKLKDSINKSTAIIAKLTRLKEVGMITSELAVQLKVKSSQLKKDEKSINRHTKEAERQRERRAEQKSVLKRELKEI